MSFLELKEEEIRRLQDYLEIFGTEAGQRVLEHMESYYEYDDIPYTKGDSNDTHRKIGNHEVIKDIKKKLDLKDREIKVIKEEREEE